MKKLMELYRDRIVGAISGLDRIRFRGTLRWLASEGGRALYCTNGQGQQGRQETRVGNGVPQVCLCVSLF